MEVEYKGKKCYVKQINLFSLKYLICDEKGNEYIMDISEFKKWVD